MSFTIDAVTRDRNFLWSCDVLVFQPCWIHLLWQFLDYSIAYLFEVKTKSYCLPFSRYMITQYIFHFLQSITPCAFSPLCTTVHGFCRGFHLNISKKEKIKNKKNCAFEMCEECLRYSTQPLGLLMTTDLEHMVLRLLVCLPLLDVRDSDFSVR